MTAETKIRPMRDEEKPAVRDIMRRSFPLVQRWFFSFTPHVLVAETGGEIQGAIVLKLFSLPRGGRGGLMYWAFTRPDARGQGMGRQLFDAGIRYLEEQGCDEILGCVEGNNTSSSNLLAARGFEILSPGRQLCRWGLHTPLVWLKIFHYIDIGHFVWAHPGPGRADSAPLQWWGNLAMNSLLLFLVFWRLKGAAFFASTLCYEIPVVFGVFFGVRELVMRLVARGHGLAMRYRAWESALPLGLVLAAGPAWWFPILGSVYPVAPGWQYRDTIRKLGPVAAAGGLALLLLSWGAWALLRWAAVPPMVLPFIKLTATLGPLAALFDIALPFFPFVSFNGRRVWDWNRPVWFVLAALAVARLFV